MKITSCASLDVIKALIIIVYASVSEQSIIPREKWKKECAIRRRIWEGERVEFLVGGELMKIIDIEEMRRKCSRKGKNDYENHS